MNKIFFIIILCLISLNTNAQLENIPLITVTGEAIETVIPDEIILQIDIIKPFTYNQLQNMRIFNFFDSEDTQVKFIGTNNNEVDQSIVLVNKTNKIELIKEVYITINDLSKYTDVLLKLYNLGFENISMVDVQTSKLKELKKQAYTNALANAHEKAVLLASSLGQNIGKAHTIEEIPQAIQNWYSEYLSTPYPTDSTFMQTVDFYKQIPGKIVVPVKVKVSFDLVK